MGARYWASLGTVFILAGCGAAVANTSAATSDAASVATAATTDMPTPPPTPTPVAAPLSLSGHGDGVVKVPSALGDAPRLLTASQHGSSNFVVEGLDATNNTKAILVNEIGTVTVTRPYNFQGMTGSVNFKITADGPWTLVFKDLSTARVFGTATSGKGDDVVEYTGAVGIATYTNHGSSNFVVSEYDPSGSQGNIDVNEIGNWTGTGTLSAGPVFLDVMSGGAWSIRCC